MVGLLVVAYLGGWTLGWVELMVVAAAALTALCFALPFIVGRLHLDVVRTLEPERVVVGEAALAVLRVRNNHPRPVAPRIIEDSVGTRRVAVDVPGLAPGRTSDAIYNLPTDRRGAIPVGPAVIVKADPLGLMRREIVQTPPTTLWVHPRHRVVRSLPVGFAKDLEGPTTDTSPAGDVAFHALREYQVGDDYRHIHWLSTARTGTVMVRHYVDNRRPHVAVLLDDTASAYSGDEFELAVEVAASIAVTGLREHQPVALRFGQQVVLGQARVGSRNDVLDRLALVQRRRGGSLKDGVTGLLAGEVDVSALVLVTGAVDVRELLVALSPARRVAHVIVVRVWPPDLVQPAALPQATVLDVRSLEEFASSWNRIAT